MHVATTPTWRDAKQKRGLKGRAPSFIQIYIARNGSAEVTQARGAPCLTGATAGNLGKQLEQLEEEGYLDSKKEFVGRRPNTTYRLLPYGREQFTQYVALLESLLAQAEEEKPET